MAFYPYTKPLLLQSEPTNQNVVGRRFALVVDNESAPNVETRFIAFFAGHLDAQGTLDLEVDTSLDGGVTTLAVAQSTQVVDPTPLREVKDIQGIGPLVRASATVTVANFTGAIVLACNKPFDLIIPGP